MIDHKALVINGLMRLAHQMWKRGMAHDTSKFEEPEYSLYASVQSEWEKYPYGSAGYEVLLNKIRPAIDHHVAHNRHHPEYFENGVSGMTLLDLVEMACDWYAASKRPGGRPMSESLPFTLKRFNIEPQLASILANTMPLLEELVGDGSPRQQELAELREEQEQLERSIAWQ